MFCVLKYKILLIGTFKKKRKSMNVSKEQSNKTFNSELWAQHYIS